MQILQVLDGADPFVRPLDGGPLVLGSAADNGLALASPGVKPRHLRIEFVDGEPWVEALEGKVLVNGRAVHRAALALGDRIEIGSAVIVLAASVARRAEPDDVLEAPRPQTRRAAAGAKSSRAERAGRSDGSKKRPFVLGGVGALALVTVLLLQAKSSTLPPVFAEFDRLRRAGSFEVAQGKLAEMERWAKDADSRTRVAKESDKLAAMIARVRERQARILQQSSERTEAEFSNELQREERSAKDEDDRIAARIVRATLYELLREAVAKTPPPERQPEHRKPEQASSGQPTAAQPKPQPVSPSAVPQPPVAVQTPGPQVSPPLPHSDADALPAALVNSDDVKAAIDGAVLQASKGEFAQAQGTLQMAIAGADPSERARLESQLTELRAAAKAQMEVLLETARSDAKDGRFESSIAALTAAGRRLPTGGEFAAVPTMLDELQRQQATRGGGNDAAVRAGVAGIDEAQRRRTLATLAPALIRIRAAEDAGDFATAATELQSAVASVRASDADYAERLELRLGDLRRVLALHDEVAALVKGGAEVAFDSVGNGAVRVVGVDGSKLRATAATGELKLDYRDLAAESLVLFAGKQKLSSTSMLGIASLLYRQDARRLAEKVLARALELDAAIKPEVDRTVAHGRGEPIDPRGYELRADGFVSAANAEAEKQAQKVLARVETALRSKDRKARAAIVQDALALGPGAVGAVAGRFQRLLDKEIEALDASPLRKQIDKLQAQRQQLDVARQAAKDLIFDEVRYFYPYKPPQVEPQRYAEYVRVQAEVNRLVDAVRSVWNDDRLRIKVPASMSDSIERLDWLATVLSELGELDALATVGVEWARALPPGASIDIHTYCQTQEERERLAHWQQIDAYNEVLCAQLDKGDAVQLRITNAYRAMFGHRPLALDLRIRSAARAHAEEMTKLGYFSHFSPTPGRKTPGDRMLIAGYTQGTGENIALVDGPEGAHNAWCQSSGHHRNLLSPSHTEAGIAGSDRNWVQNFGHGVEYLQKLADVPKPSKPR